MTDLTISTAQKAPVSDGQRLLWLMKSLTGGPGVMNVPIIYRMRGALDMKALSTAMTDLVARHESLRTTFEKTDSVDTLCQYIHPPCTVDVECVDVSGEPEPYEAAYEHIGTRLVQDIDVVSDLPFTVDLYRLAEDDQLLMINVDHFVTDAWSNMLICRDLGNFYNRALGRPVDELAPVDWPITRYIGWQRERLEGTPGKGHADFWRQRLAQMNYYEFRPFPDRPGYKRPPSENVWFTVEGSQVQRLRELAAQERTTLFIMMLALFYGVLYAAADSDNLTVGSVFANRPRRELFETVGFFANLVALGTQFPANASFRDVLRAVRRTVLEALAHQEFPYLNTMLDPSMPEGALRASETVFHMLAVPENVSPPNGIPFAGLEVEAHPIPNGMGSRFDLELLIVPQVDMLEGVYRYAGDRYEKEFIERLSEDYQTLVATVADDMTTPLREILRRTEGS